MSQIRRFRNDDVPVLADLWNRGLPVVGTAGPLAPHEIAAALCGHLFFDADGLLLAEGSNGRALGFVHAAFGPLDPDEPPHRPDFAMGTVASLVLDPTTTTEPVAADLFHAALSYLRSKGATVLYAGGQRPLNPFYWGLYGGSEFSGILDADRPFQDEARRAGFAPVARTRRFELDLSVLDHLPRDPRLVILKRQSDLLIDEDCQLSSWWDALAIGSARPIAFRLLDRKQAELARATSWDMAGFDRRDSRLRCGIIDVAVPPEHRGKGHARHLLIEAMRHLRQQAIQVVEVQTSTTNQPGLALYESLGMRPIGESTLFRAPGPD